MPFLAALPNVPNLVGNTRCIHLLWSGILVEHPSYAADPSYARSYTLDLVAPGTFANFDQ